MEPYLHKWLKSENGFVRAIAFEAYDCVIDYVPELKRVSSHLFNCLERDKAAVQHKAKNILKKRGFSSI